MHIFHRAKERLGVCDLSIERSFDSLLGSLDFGDSQIEIFKLRAVYGKHEFVNRDF